MHVQLYNMSSVPYNSQLPISNHLEYDEDEKKSRGSKLGLKYKMIYWRKTLCSSLARWRKLILLISLALFLFIWISDSTISRNPSTTSFQGQNSNDNKLSNTGSSINSKRYVPHILRDQDGRFGIKILGLSLY